MKFLRLEPLTPPLLSAAVALDQLCLGALWTLEGYQRELDSPNSELIALLAGVESRESQLKPQTSNLSHLPHPLIGLGCMWAILEEAHITVLAIHPDYQKQGFGQALLLALLVLAWKRGLEWATLEVRASNQAAIALYKKFGFETVGHRRKYYQDTGEDALILWRQGLQRPEFQQTLQIWRQQVRDRLHHSGWQACVSNNLPYASDLSLDLDLHSWEQSFFG